MNMLLDYFCRLTEEATDGDSITLDSRTLGFISRAAFEVDDYWRIVDILHKRFCLCALQI